MLRLLPTSYEDKVGNIMKSLEVGETKFDQAINAAEKDTTSEIKT